MNEAIKTSSFQHARDSMPSARRSITPAVFANNRYRIPQLTSSWSMELTDRLNELTSLPVGWDGYLGRPVSFQSALFVSSMLERLCQDDVPAPSLVPGSDGSLQVEWHRNMFDVELDVIDAQNVIATRVNHRNNEEQVIELQNDFTEIVPWISDLSFDAVNLG